MIRSPLSIILFVTIMKHITALATTRAIIDSSRRTAFRSSANVNTSRRLSIVPLTARYSSRSTENPRTRSVGWAIHSSNVSLSTNNVALFSSATDGNELRKFTVAELKVKLKEKGLPTSGLKAELVERLATAGGSSSTQTQSPEKSAGPKKQKQSGKRKIVINPNWKTEFNVKALEDEFNKLAKNEGFDETTAYYADDATFEDDFLEEDYNFDDDDLDSDDDDIPDFGNAGQSMEERLAAAKQDQMMGRVSVPKSLDTFSQEVSFEDLQKLGFRKEVNPFGNDETPRRDQFKIISGSMTCSGCGANFQKKDDMRPGFLPEDKFDIQTKLSKIEEVQKMQEKAESADWSPEDEVEWLLREGEPDSEDSEENMLNMSVDEMAELQGLDLDVLTKKKVLCKRCHGLQNFGTVEQNLRPGWTDEPMLSQEEFRKLLLPLRQKNAVILALVDLFDFSGSVLPELDEIAGDNPVILAANKADLLPSEMGQARAENWVRRELEYLNVQSIANIGGAVRLVSCKTGYGIKAMMEKAKNLAEEMDADIYVVGAANAGKSTLVNYLLDENNPAKKEGFKGKKRAGNANKWKGSVTTSPLPGTTLKFIRIELGKGRALYDTPGLLVPGCLTERLTPEELKIVVPKK